MAEEATSYNKHSGYYTPQSGKTPSTSSEAAQLEAAESKANIIDIPWDNDSFDLGLDSFPSTESSTKKYNKLPVIASPLRMQWVSRNDSSGGESSIQENESVSTSSNDSKSKRKKTLTINPSIDNSFPYINDDAFLDRIHPPKKKQQKQKSKTGRIEHISPLLDSAIIFDEQDVLFKSYSIKSVSSFTNHSHKSNTSTIENWKVSQSPVNGMISPIVLPPNPIIAREHNTSGSTTPRSHISAHAPQPPLTYSASIRSIGPNSISASGAYYTPPSSVTSHSYRSIHVPRNGDDLVLYSDSIYSTSPSEKNRPYSQFFNPSYQHSRGKKPAGLFTKMMKNFKHHFANK
ncbi:uncharacterized protein EV154DRAFT_559674 [Mucor mucedo]|uniref:uncharacterized protein n=1 Tax=Mucor mucedo TaxID=29922 RepID=UPI00221E3A7D|nr:uncharacterized protein EV154DRAFT_559674 [Mucor mucedo]KAI7895258.1 hypothetical protein EV154DRAFT_559674 [Mucor mucedo]